MLSARQKICFFKGGYDTCLTKEQNIPGRAGEHVPSLAGYVGEKLYVDLVSMSETIMENQYMLTAEDSFSRYCRAYLITNKKAHRVAKVLMDQHFKVYGLLDSDNGKEFVNNLWSYSQNSIFSTLPLRCTIHHLIQWNVSTGH